MKNAIQQTFTIAGLDGVWFAWDDDPQFLSDGYKYAAWAEVVDRHFVDAQGETLEATTRLVLLQMAQKLAAMQKAIFDEYVRRLSQESQHS